MTPPTIICILLSASTLICAAGWLGNYKLRVQWRERCAQRDETIRKLELESITLTSPGDVAALEWYKKENARLESKCSAICASVRRLKGRGKCTTNVHPIHNF